MLPGGRWLLQAHKADEIILFSHNSDKVSMILVLYLKLEVMNNQRGRKKALSAQQKEERVTWVQDVLCPVFENRVL